MEKSSENADLVLHNRLVDMLEDVWLHIDWAEMGNNRKRTIHSEVEGQVRALARSCSSLEKFIDKVCRRFRSHIIKKNNLELLNDKINEDVYMDILRNETHILMLILRIRREEAKQSYQAVKPVLIINQIEQ